MSLKSDDLVTIREDLDAVKTALGLLGDWISNKFGMEVFDKNLLFRNRHQGTNKSDLNQIKPIHNVVNHHRALIPLMPKPIDAQPLFHQEILNRFHDIQIPLIGQPIPIIRHAEQNEYTAQSSSTSNPIPTAQGFMLLDNGCPSQNFINSEIMDPTPTLSSNSVVDSLTFTSNESPQMDALNSSNSFNFSVLLSESENDSKSKSPKKPQKKTKNKKSSVSKRTKPPEDTSEIQCEVCGKILNGQAAMKRHMQTHKQRSHVCNDCGKSFQRSFHLKTHRMTHDPNQKKHMCGFCGRMFLLPKDLVCHERTHTGEKPFACTSCPRRFNLKSHLTMHMRLHTGEKPYFCDLCDKTFSQSNSLRVHKKTHQQKSQEGSISAPFESIKLGQLNTQPTSSCDIVGNINVSLTGQSTTKSQDQEQSERNTDGEQLVNRMNPSMEEHYQSFETESNSNPFFVLKQ